MAEMTTGQRVARARRRKGWTQAELAQRVGRSASWVAKIEGGFASLDRRSVLDHLADVLGVEVVELTGQPFRHESPAQDSGHAGIPALRLALQRAALPMLAGLDRPVRTLAEITADVESIEALRQAARFDVVAGRLPSVIEELVILGRSGPQDQVGSLMVRACHVARVMSNLTGHHDLAWTALERELSAASSIGAPVEMAAAHWDLCWAWLHAGAVVEAQSAATSALDALDAHVGTGDDVTDQMWGALHLRAAIAAARRWNTVEARSHLEEARRVIPAERDANAWQTNFCAPVHAVHAVEVEVELGHPGDAVRLAGEVPVADMHAGERLSHYWILTARASQMNAQSDRALRAILEAERIAGPYVINRPMTHDLVNGLLHTSRGVPDELRRLADVIGVA
ncbi:MAG TPA: helix-turn-helix transcriptional regulator [Kineosporiaceae bacterium]